MTDNRPANIRKSALSIFSATTSWFFRIYTAIIAVLVILLLIALGGSFTGSDWGAIVIGILALSAAVLGLFALRIWDPSRLHASSKDRAVEVPASDRFRTQMIRLDFYLIAYLIVLAVASFVMSYLASRAVLVSVSENKFGPSETAQVITAAGGLGLAIGSSIAAIIKAYALLIRARADFLRAKWNLPSDKEFKEMSNRELPGSE